MKSEMRREFARESFEEKIRKVGELIRLSRKLKSGRVHEDANNYAQSGSQVEFTRRGGPKNSNK